MQSQQKSFSSVYKCLVPAGVKPPITPEKPFHPWNSVRSYAGYNPFGIATMLATSTGSLNIAQGFPDFDTIAITKDNLSRVAEERFEECVKASPYAGNLEFR